jgi:hypoxanthine phosphoribosyltransferase
MNWNLLMKTLLSEQQLREGVERLASEIDGHYGQQPLTIVAVMTGSLVLFADLIRMLSMPLRVGVVQASSYRGGMTAGDLVVDKRMMIDVQGRDVMLVDDIFDTGQTLQRLMDEVGQMGAASVKSAVLLQKQRQHDVVLRPDFVAFEIPDEFVVGYGLDFQDHFRNLPFLGVLEDCDFVQFKTGSR